VEQVINTAQRYTKKYQPAQSVALYSAVQIAAENPVSVAAVAGHEPEPA